MKSTGPARVASGVWNFQHGIRRRAVKSCDVTDTVYQLGVNLPTNSLYHGCLLITTGGIQANLEQFMVFNTDFDFADDGVGQPCGSHDDHRFEGMGAGPEEFLLFGG